MFLMWIIALLLIGSAVYAVAGNNLANALRPVASRTCSHCERAAQSDWKNCPQCGQIL